MTSNVLRSDYAGSASCAPCHAQISQSWSRSPMHRMTRAPQGAVVRAPFDGSSFQFKEDRVSFESRAGERFMRLDSVASGGHLYQVTRIIGGRYREDYAGREVTDGGAAAASRDEVVLPVSYVFASGSFRHKGYSVMNPERPGLKAGPVWTQTCIGCHNTLPYFTSVLGALAGPGAPPYQGEVVDPLLPTARRWSWRITDEAGLRAALAAEMKTLGAKPAQPGGELASGLRQAILDTRQRLGSDHLIELGIGCESCHGGSAEHVANPAALPSYEPRASFLEARPPPGVTATRALLVNRTCARCHQVLFSRYPYTWEGGARKDAPGGSSINSGEARDFLLGGCAGALACTACHDPHGEDSPEQLAALATPKGNGVCTSCHGQYGNAEALRAHAHHDPASAGASCVGCHLPRKNTGLGYELTRYHRIGSPNEPVRVEHDRPLECALCHADRTVSGLVAQMERWWGKRYDRAALVRLYGSLEAEPLGATLTRGLPHEQLAAAAVLGEHRVLAARPGLEELLVHPYPLVRSYALRALERLTGRSVPVNLNQDAAAIRADLSAWRSARPPDAGR